MLQIDTPAMVWNSYMANGHQISMILARYGSPLKANASTIALLSAAENINPLLILAVMQVESALGNLHSRPTLHAENVSNPFSVHFNQHAKGIDKLRLPNGVAPTFEQSLRAFVRDFKGCSLHSPTPIASYRQRHQLPLSWTAEICNAMHRMQMQTTLA